ncbi:MAG: hypothetical protein VX194_07050 [Actinomycetota bacterium]|nr:hypothetical protein [Actinomycetota bacterium]MEC7967391.1 hypothetical protein [Actinomycetota bacterium]
MTKLRHSALLRLLVALFSFALIASACVSTEDEDADTTDGAGTATDDSTADDTAAEDDSTADDTAAEDDSTDDAAEEPVALTASWRGVTEDTIYVGVSLLDFELLVELGFSPSGWGDQAAVWEALVDDLNARGGINGRMVDITSEFYSPIDAADAERVCAVLHQDNETFANLGGFLGPAGSADPCVTGTNNTVMVGGEISSAEELAQANVAWFHAGPTTEFQTVNLFNLLVQTGETDGARVFTMGGAAAADEESFVLEQLEARGIEVVGSALIEALDGDTIAQDNELAVAFERFNASGANTLMVFGTPSASIRGAGAAGLTGEIAIWSNDSAGLGNLGATIVDKSIADGTLASTGPTDEDVWNDQDFQDRCVAPVQERIPESDLRNPLEYAPEEDNWFNSVRQGCQALSIFETIATAAGPVLTPETFEAAAYGPAGDNFQVPGMGPASLSPDKRGARDGVRLSVYDSTAGDGGLVAFTELLDAFE